MPDPVVSDVNALSGAERAQFLNDMVVIGDAPIDVTEAFRINYSILGNGDPALHVHIHPRYLTEPEKQRKGPAYLTYSSDELRSRPFDLSRDKPLMEKLAAAIRARLP